MVVPETADLSEDRMTLLEDALRAYGGGTRWQRFTRFVIHMSLRGTLIAAASKKAACHEIVAEGLFQTPRIQLTGFSAPDRRSICETDRVAIQDSLGTVLEVRERPIETLQQRPSPAQWDDLDLACFFAMSIWDHVTTPFRLANPDLVTEELPQLLERGNA